MKAAIPSDNAAQPFAAKQISRAVIAACTLLCASAAQAGGTISMGEDKSISLGLGLKTSYTSTEDAAPDGSRSSDFNVDSARLYIGASLSKYVKATLNTEKDANDNVKILDAFGAFNFMPEFNIQAGRTIVPSDRANLSGGYYLPAWDFAGVASQFYSKFASRDDGMLAWGKVLDKKLVYSAGVFQGRNHNVPGGSNTSDEMMFAGRLAFNFWDPEPAPAYLTGSTYYGAANIFTVGLVFQQQSDGVGSGLVKDDYSSWGVDALMETKLGAGVITVEGAYSEYDWSNAAATADPSGSPAGDAFLVSLAYLFPEKFGWGKFQPFYRYQEFDPNAPGDTVKRNDLGLNYLIDGANTRIVATYRSDDTGSATIDSFIVGLQLQY